MSLKKIKTLWSSFNNIMLRCILKISKNMSLKKIQIVLLMSKLFWTCFYVSFKQWLQKVKSPYMYVSLKRLIPNFYDMCIKYSQ
jgi:hypothetical protein